MPPPHVNPLFFSSALAFRDWLARHAATEDELIVGFHKVATGRPCMTWSESVDEALCVGWIDGVRKRVDDDAYQIRFTPRKPTSIWSAVNIAKVQALQAQGRMTPAGERAYGLRTASKSVVYSYEQSEASELSAAEMAAFKSNAVAWTYWESTPPGYRKQMLHRVATAKREETRARRLRALVDACTAHQRLL
jgi:uncharacterized protein YdeI (YjbR/CyaY-like superfamily)